MAGSETAQHDGTMTAVLVVVIIIGVLSAALWCAIAATKTIFATGGIPLLQYGQTLFAWDSRVIYATQTLLPHPLASHVISVVVIVGVLLVLLIFTSRIARALSAGIRLRSSGGCAMTTAYRNLRPSGGEMIPNTGNKEL